MEVELYPLFPGSCAVNKEIPVEKFIDLGSPSASEAHLIKLYTVRITLRYLFRVNHGDFTWIKQNKNSQEELHILEAEIKTKSDGWYRIHQYAKAIIQCYPQNVLLILRYKDEYCCFISKTHYNSKNNNKNVTDVTRGSGWFSEENHLEFSVDPLIDYPIMFKYSKTRETVSRMINHFRTAKSIDELMQAWFTDIEDDRSAWSYFLHWDLDYYNHRTLAAEVRTWEKEAERILKKRTLIDEKSIHLEDDDDNEYDDEILFEEAFVTDDDSYDFEDADDEDY